jgi:carbonic anhydrase
MLALSCLDNRIPVEDFLAKGTVDLSVTHVAGNFMNKYVLSRTAFATNILDSKLLLIIGREYFNVVNAALYAQK